MLDSRGAAGKQEAVFESLGRELVRHALHGRHACLLAYGRANSGKTYASFGDDAALLGSTALPSSAGLLPRSLEAIFAALADDETAVCAASFYEICDDQVHDLLESAPLSPQGSAVRAAMRVHGDRPMPGRRRTAASGPTEMICESFEDALGAVARGALGRRVCDAAPGGRKSGSHAVFTFRVQRLGESANQGTLRMVDLAGSLTTGKELTLINRMLFHTARGVRKLTDEVASSQLALAVRHALSGNALTVLLGAVSVAG